MPILQATSNFEIVIDIIEFVHTAVNTNKANLPLIQHNLCTFFGGK